MTAYTNAKLEVVTTPQSVFDAFNEFMFSNDEKILTKLLARYNLFNMVRDVPGDVVEMGVFKGTGLSTFLKMKRIIFPTMSPKKVIGFDYFNTAALVRSLSGIDQERMSSLFTDRNFEHGDRGEEIVQFSLERAGFTASSDFELISGDVGVTAPKFVAERPGFRCCLLYLDLDVEGPTTAALEALWDRIPVGGIVAFDEYGIHQWSEANAADSFFNKRKHQIRSLDAPCPTAYVRKEFE